MRIVVRGQKHKGVISFTLPGDKSIAHRALIIGALPEGEYTITNFPFSLDCMATLDCMRKLGVNIENCNNKLKVTSKGYKKFNKNSGILDAKNSGTTARLLSGIISGANLEATLVGDVSLSKRPMNRIIDPLKLMGAEIESNYGVLPMKFFRGGDLGGITYTMPVASAQVKSCILLAGFLAHNETTVIEEISTRDHTERMLKYLDANVKVNNNKITINNSQINSKDIYVPGDISSAAFLIAAAILSQDCEVKIEKVLLNEGRSKYLQVLKAMGADIEVEYSEKCNEEEVGTIRARSSNLKSVRISKELLPSIIDEVPVLSVLAAFSEGTTEICGVDELKHKESNRVKAIVDNLKQCGKEITYIDDSIIIHGKDDYINREVSIDSFNDHRIAMAFMALSARNKGNTIVNQWECTEISFPNAINYFKELLNIEP